MSVGKRLCPQQTGSVSLNLWTNVSVQNKRSQFHETCGQTSLSTTNGVSFTKLVSFAAADPRFPRRGAPTPTIFYSIFDSLTLVPYGEGSVADPEFLRGGVNCKPGCTNLLFWSLYLSFWIRHRGLP